MKWIFLNKTTHEEFYELWDNDKKILSVLYAPASGIVKLFSALEKRIFSIDKIKNTFSLLNEYGVDLIKLHISPEKNNEGILKTSNDKLAYKIEQNKASFFTSKSPEIKSCELLNEREMALQLLTASWVITQPGLATV